MDDKKTNINTSTPEELQTLPGIGPAIADKISLRRINIGPFMSKEEIKEIGWIVKFI